MLILFENAPKKNFRYPFTIGFLRWFFFVFSIRGLLLILLIFATVLIVVVGYYSIHRTSLPFSRAKFPFLHTYTSQFVVCLCAYFSLVFFSFISLILIRAKFVYLVHLKRINQLIYQWNAFIFACKRTQFQSIYFEMLNISCSDGIFFFSSRKIQIRCEEIQSNKQFRIDLTIYRNATLIANKQRFF